jgi:hypothetical protein
MNLAPFQQVQLGGAKRFEEFHFHFGIALGVLAHECRKHAFDHCGVAATFSTPLSPRRRSSARSPSAPTWPNRLRQSPSNCSPSPVRTSRRPTRSKSMRPSSCSRSLICRDKAGWRAALSPLRRQPRIGLDPVGAGSAEPGLRGGDGGRFGLDEEGDEYFSRPHIYVSDPPFRNYESCSLETIDPPRRSAYPSDQKRTKVFPRADDPV